MFIFWGRKIVYRKIGYVADFCPICRSKRSFVLRRVGSASHVYYLSIGEGELVGFERTCLECQTPYNADPHTYASVSKKNEPLDTLTNLTFPDFEKALQERLEIEARLQKEPLSFSPQDRHALIRNPFLFLSPKVERRFSSTHVDTGVGLSFIAAIVLLFLGTAAVSGFFPDSEGTVLLVFLAIGIALVLWQVVQSRRRFMRREVIPVLGKALQPLQPSENEIQAVIAELKQHGHKIGSKLVLADLYFVLALRLS